MMLSKKCLKVLEYKQDNFTVYPRIVETVEDEIFDIVFIATKTCDFEFASIPPLK